MKNSLYLAAFVVFTLFSCKNNEKEETVVSQEAFGKDVSYEVYGDNFAAGNTFNASGMEERYRDMEIGDTLELSFRSTVNTVCKNKGCWMTLALPDTGENVMVKFRDYGFFVPKDIEEKEVVVNGKAYVTEVSVEEQQHYAEDDGRSEEEIAAITQPRRTYSFIADGVLIKE